MNKKRNEQIMEAADAYNSDHMFQQDMGFAYGAAFMSGAVWADTNPHWISLQEEKPEVGERVLLCDTYDAPSSTLYQTFGWLEKIVDDCGEEALQWMLDYSKIVPFDWFNYWRPLLPIPKGGDE